MELLLVSSYMIFITSLLILITTCAIMLYIKIKHQPRNKKGINKDNNLIYSDYSNNGNTSTEIAETINIDKNKDDINLLSDADFQNQRYQECTNSNLQIKNDTSITKNVEQEATTLESQNENFSLQSELVNLGKEIVNSGQEIKKHVTTTNITEEDNHNLINLHQNEYSFESLPKEEAEEEKLQQVEHEPTLDNIQQEDQKEKWESNAEDQIEEMVNTEPKITEIASSAEPAKIEDVLRVVGKTKVRKFRNKH